MAQPFTPTYSDPARVLDDLRVNGYAALTPDALAEVCGVAGADLATLGPGWDALPADQYLKDGGRYRSRRHSCFVADGGQLLLQPHRAHWQSLDYNALHGGMQRWFEPITPETLDNPAW